VNIAAEKLWRKGARKAAADLFLAGAKCGDRSCQLNAGYFCARGIGVRRNSSVALTWYKRAYRHGDANAANSVGSIWRDKRRSKEAFALVQSRGQVKLGNVSSNLEIAKICCYRTNDN